MSLKPKPPSFFPFRLTGSLKHDIVYVGIDERTDLRRTILPTLDSSFEDQEIALCLILFTMELNSSYFSLPKCSGSPRYFPTPPSVSIPKACFTLILVFCEVFLEKVIADFWQFIFCPEAIS